jgi:Na+/pantothenate symporter
LCGAEGGAYALFLTEMSWIFVTVWEILALCLAIWIVVKHFHELQRSSTGLTAGDCFKVLIETHVFYFAR